MSDEMAGKVRNSVEEFINQQKENHESAKEFLACYLSENELAATVANVKDYIAKEAYGKLSDPSVGETIAKLAMNHIGKKLNGDGANILFAGLSRLGKGLGGCRRRCLGSMWFKKSLACFASRPRRF